MISHEHRCIFIHIPKNGGASIEKLIWSDMEARSEDELWMGYKTPHHNAYQTGALQHLFATNIIRAVGLKTYQEYFSFSMVRNPWDKAISQFLYLQKRHDLRSFLDVPRHVSFKSYLEKIQEKPHVHWQPQYLFLTDDQGEIIVDYIGRFEDYASSVAHILGRLDIAKSEELPHLNRSSRSPYYHYYDDESREMVAEIYARDIQLFDYSFDQKSFESRRAQIKFGTPSNLLASKWANFKDRLS